jgi:hypothetical protein
VLCNLDAKNASTWWLYIESGDSHRGPLTYDERQNADSARVAVNNIVVHFDIRYCRGIRVPPYTGEELARSAAFRAKRGVA